MRSRMGWLRATALVAALFPALTSGAWAQGADLNTLIDRARRRQPHPLQAGHRRRFRPRQRSPSRQQGPLSDVAVGGAGPRHQGRHHGVRSGLQADRSARTHDLHGALHPLRNLQAAARRECDPAQPFADGDPVRRLAQCRCVRSFNSAGFLHPDVPIFEMRKQFGSRSLLVPDAKVAKALAETLGDRPVALMRGHGNVVVGPSIRAHGVARDLH